MRKGMRQRLRSGAAVAALAIAGLAATPPSAKPEDVGMSAERLTRIHPMIQAHAHLIERTGLWLDRRQVLQRG